MTTANPRIYGLPSNFKIVKICSVRLLVSDIPRAKFVTPSINSKWKYVKLVSPN